MTKQFERKQAERWGSQVPYTEPGWGSGYTSIWDSIDRQRGKGFAQFDQLPADKSVLLNDSLLAEGETIVDTVLPWISATGLKMRRYERVMVGEDHRIAFTFKNARAAMLFKLSWG
jgi:hypothetical protein